MLCDGIEKYRESIVLHLSELIKFKSIQGPAEPGMPFGRGVHGALCYMLNLSKDLGFTTVNLDGYCGYAEYGVGDELVCIPSHLDVVPEGIGWTHPPYGGLMENNRVYGRGASDNKVSCVASLYALAVLRESCIGLKRRVRVIFGANEESGMLDMAYYVKKEGLPDLAFSPDGGFSIINGEKGIARILFSAQAENGEKDGTVIREITGGDAPNRVPEVCFATLSHNGNRTELKLDGRAGHGAAPGSGINAALQMVSLLRPYITQGRGLLPFILSKIGLEFDGGSLGIACSDDLFGPLTLNAGILKYDSAGSSLLTDIRYPLCTDLAAIRRKLESEAAPFGVSLEVKEDMPPFYVEKDAGIIRLLSQVYRETTGTDVEIGTSGGGSYSKVFAGRCVLFGGAGANGHGPDEYVDVDQMMCHARLCTHAMYTLAVADGEIYR